MRSRAVAFALMGCMLTGACRREDLRTTTIRCPQATDAACAGLIIKALASTEGVRPESIRIEGSTVSVRYNSMKVAIKNLEFVIADAGFDAGEFPANPEARSALPAGCR